MRGTASTVVKWVGGLIGTYLVVYYATGAGTVVKAGSEGAQGVIKVLQARG